MRSLKIFFLILVVASTAMQKSMHKNCMQGKISELNIEPDLENKISLAKELLERECNRILVQNNISKNIKGCLLRGFVKNAKANYSSPEIKELFSLLTKTCEQAVMENDKVKFENQEKSDELNADLVNTSGIFGFF